MAYSPYGGYPGYGMQQTPVQYGQYTQPAQDQLTQLRQMQQPQPMQPPTAPMAQAAPPDMIWVQGEAAAKAYMVVPGSRVVLWDSEGQTLYIKSMDASGIPSMRTFDYVERTDAPQMPAAPRRRQGGEYVTRTELGALAARLEALEGLLSKEVQGDGEPAV